MRRGDTSDDVSSGKKAIRLSRQNEGQVEFNARQLAATLESDAIRHYLIHCGKHFLEKVEVDWPMGEGKTRKANLNRYLEIEHKRGSSSFGQIGEVMTASDTYLAGEAVKGPTDQMELRHFCLVTELPSGVVLEAIAGQMDPALARIFHDSLATNGTYSVLSRLEDRLGSFVGALKNQLEHAERAREHVSFACIQQNYREG